MLYLRAARQRAKVVAMAALALTIAPAIALGEATPCNVNHFVVTLGMELYTILDLNEDTEVFGSKQAIYMKWNDETLVDPPRDGGSDVRSIRASDLQCLPSLILEESVENFRLPPPGHPLLVNTTSGYVSLMHQFTYQGVCKVDPTYYPFDKQICLMTVYSEVQEMRLEVLRFSTESYYSHGEFELLNATAEVEVSDIDALETAFFGRRSSGYSVVFAVLMRRKPLFYIVTLIIPTTLVVVVAVIGLFSAMGSSPVRSSKAQLGIMAMLSMGIQMLTINKEVPVNSDKMTPLTIYYSVLIILTASSTVLSVYLVHVHHVKVVKRKPVSAWWTCLGCKLISVRVCRKVPVLLMLVTRSSREMFLYAKK